MSYHRLPNLGGLIKGDLVTNLQKGLSSKEFVDIEWNWNLTTKVNGMCANRSEYQRCCVFYKFTYKCCGDFYDVNTQNTLKIMEQNFQNVAQKIMHNINLDSFAAHFARGFVQNQSHNNVTILFFSEYFLQ